MVKNLPAVRETWVWSLGWEDPLKEGMATHSSIPVADIDRILFFWAPRLAQMVKNLPALQETCIQSLGQEDPLEKEMVTHSSILAWRISWTEEPSGL